MTTHETDTPETDQRTFTITEYQENRFGSGPSEKTIEVVSANDMRVMERKLNAEREKNERLEREFTIALNALEEHAKLGNEPFAKDALEKLYSIWEETNGTRNTARS